MNILAVVAMAISQLSFSSADVLWAQRIIISEQNQKVVVAVEARNTTNQSVDIVPGWGFGLRYVSGDNDEFSMCEYLVQEEMRLLRIGAKRETHFSLSGEYLPGNLYEGQFVDKVKQPSLGPGETVSDTLFIQIDKEVFKPCPGKIEVLYRLQFCVSEAGVLWVIPPEKEESAVVGEVSVP